MTKTGREFSHGDEKKSTGEKEGKKGRAKLNKLPLNKETVKDLSDIEEKQIKGGIMANRPKMTDGGGATIGCNTVGGATLGSLTQ